MALLKPARTAERWTLKLIAPPGLEEIHQFLSQALENRGQRIGISWAVGKKSFMLVVVSRPQGGEVQWQLSAGPKDKLVVLWTHSSCDVILIYNLIGLSCSEDGHPCVPAERALSVPEPSRVGNNAGRLFCKLRSGGEPEGGKEQLTSSGSIFAGDLSSFDMFTLLQHVLRTQMTGCVNFRNGRGERAEIHVVNGHPVHAGCAELTGDDCIIELLTWKEGSFAFSPDRVTTSRTVTQSIESLLLLGMRLLDILGQLENLGFGRETIPVKHKADICEQEFEQSLVERFKVSLDAQKRLFLACDGQRSAGQILDMLQMPKRIWAPAMVNLLASRLLGLKNSSGGHLAPKRIDQSILHEVMSVLRHTNSGLYTYPAFLYFLEQEYFRACRTGSPMSVMIFDIKARTEYGGERQLTQEETVELLSWVNRLKRHTDLFADYEGNYFAMLLPETSTGGAKVFASRMVNGLLNQARLSGKDLTVHAGLALCDKNAHSLGLLLAAAEAARDFAKMTETGLVDFEAILPPTKESAQVLTAKPSRNMHIVA